jgi:hypothetical protein
VRSLAALLAVLALAGCGAEARRSEAPRPPRLPRALAESWAQQANAVAAALAAGDGCTARTRADALQREVIDAVNAHRVPQRLLEPLSSGVNDLASRITCMPPPAGVSNGEGDAGDRGAHEKHDRGRGHGNGHSKGHGKGKD